MIQGPYHWKSLICKWNMLYVNFKTIFKKMDKAFRQNYLQVLNVRVDFIHRDLKIYPNDYLQKPIERTTY